MIGQAVRFSLVGIGITLIHLVIAGALTLNGLSVHVANRVAFCVALLCGFLGHSCFSFAGHAVPKKCAFGKYLIVALAGFLVNETILALLLLTKIIAPIFALALAIVGAATFSFFGSQLWVFRSRTGLNK